MTRGEVRWCDLGEPSDGSPAKRRPVLIIQADEYNRSRLATTVVAVLSSNTTLAAMPGNVFLPMGSTGLPKDSVVNVTALATIDRRRLDPQPVGRVPDHLMSDVDDGVRRILGLGHGA